MKPLIPAVAAIIIVPGVTAPLFGGDAALVKARVLLDRVWLVDGHNDLPLVERNDGRP